MHDLLIKAGAQFGLFTRRQAHGCGVTDRMLRRRVANGLIDQVARGVYRVVGSAPSWQQHLLSACLGGGDQCVASHRAAAHLHALDTFPSAPIEVTVPREIRYRAAGVIVHQSLDLTPQDRCLVGPVPATTPARTLIDLGAVARWQHVEEAFDGAERDRQVRRDEVARDHQRVRRRGRRGVGPMAIVLDHRISTPPQSVLERRFVRLLEDASIPTPTLQYKLALPSGAVAYLDAAHPRPRLGWELDGHGAHATRRQRASDNARASEIADLGWQLRRFTYEQVQHDGAYVVRTVRSALASRSCDI